MKLLFLNTNIGYGGASKMIVWVASQCAKNGYDVTFLTYRDKVICQSIDPMVKLVHEQLEDVGGRSNFLLSVKCIHNFIKKNSFDIGIAFLSPSILRLALAAKGTGIKLLFSQRGDPYVNIGNSLKNKVINIINQWAFRQADAFVFQTEMAQAFYSNAIQARSVVIPNPIKPMLRSEERKGNVRKSFVSVGRLDLKQKRQDLLIEAFNLISSKYPDFKLEIYGDGEDEAKIKTLVATNPNILLKGKTSDVAAAIQNAWSFVLSSDFEGIPNALLEAMSLGVPCISTDCSPGGAAMLIHNNENGILTPRGDKRTLANAMEYVIKHFDKAEAMGVAAKDVNILYAERVISKKWLNLIRNM